MASSVYSQAIGGKGGVPITFPGRQNIHALKLTPIRSTALFFCTTFKTPISLSVKSLRKASVISISCSLELERKEVPGSGPKKKLAVFVSGSGSNFKALQEATLRNDIQGTVEVVVTDKPGCKASDYAMINKIPVLVFPKSKSSPEGLTLADFIQKLRYFEIDYILLAGYLKMIPPEIINAFPKSILNIHPSLLPAFGGKGFYGIKVHEAVIASGARFSGATIHFVDEHYDTGKIIAQTVVPVLANDTPENLAARVLKEEHLLYVEVVRALCDGRIYWREDGVPLIRKAWDSEEYY